MSVTPTITTRRLPIGAEIVPGGVHFRVWAPDRRAVSVVIDDMDARTQRASGTPLAREASGHFSGLVREARAGTRYWFELDERDRLLPDPASRFQPEGPHGPSQVIDPSLFVWTDGHWPGCTLDGQVMYELHVGTFTPEGTWRAAADKLPVLRDLGITMVEIMPIADFPGRFGWGYDGVNWFAPTRLYGEPDDCRAFVDRAHALGLGVILDVVYNHIGPDGNYLREFARAYFSDRYENEWGDPLNFDGPGADGMRELVLANVRSWVEDFHVDGFRLDATQQIFDASADHILAALTREARAAAHPRHVVIAAENEEQLTRLMLPVDPHNPARAGYGIDALWNDDFHHAALVALTGHREAYCSDYRGSATELVACAKWGFLFHGQHYTWQQKPRGEPAFACAPAQFVTYIENHDQVANSAHGLRLHQRTSPGRYRAMTALLLLLPGTPLLFQGQEFASSRPFLFFADHHDRLRNDVRKGRAAFLAQFPSIADPAVQALLPDPGDPDVFARCILDWREHAANAHIVDMHRDLLALRRETPVFRAQRPRGLDGAPLAGDGSGSQALVLRVFDPATLDPAAVPAGGDRLILMNLGSDLPLNPLSEPLLAPPADSTWTIVWSSEDPRYGGNGTPPLDPADWRLPGETLLVLAPAPR